MSLKLRQIIVEDRRLVFLRFLAEANDYSNNEFVIRDALVYMGHNVSLDQVHTDAAWLEEQGLVTISAVVPDLSVYRLTSRGKDVAGGRAEVPGVKRPEPGLDY